MVLYSLCDVMVNDRQPSADVAGRLPSVVGMLTRVGGILCTEVSFSELRTKLSESIIVRREMEDLADVLLERKYGANNGRHAVVKSSSC